MKVRGLPSLKQFFRVHFKKPVFGAGVYAFHRLGPEEFMPDYRILALRDSLETRLIEQSVKVIALEKGMGTRHLSAPRNATTVLSHPRIRSYLQQFPDPLILVYKTSGKMERLAKKNGWVLAQAPIAFGKNLFENKIIFRKVLQEIGARAPSGEILTFSHTLKDLKEKSAADKLMALFPGFKNTYGLPFVIQHPTRGGGKGTFFINSEEEFFEALKRIRVKTGEGEKREEERKKTEVIIAKFIRGPSPSITGCVTRHGVLSTSLQHQVLDSPYLYNPAKGSGLFCGHDWSSSRFSEEVSRSAYSITDRVGAYLKKRGYKGIFGLDFVLDEKTQKLYVTECNPRLTAASPTLSMVQLQNNEPPIIAFHLLEHANIDYQLDVGNINDLMRREKQGAQVVMHNLSGRWAKNQKELRAGVYRLEALAPSAVEGQGPRPQPPSDSFEEQVKLQFVRPGYGLKHLKNREEFLITEGVPFRKSHFSPSRRLMRILTQRSVLRRPPGQLTPWTERVTKTVYSELDLKPVRFAGIIKLFNPGYLAKG